MSKKKRDKKHSIKKSGTRMARHYLRNVGVVFVPAMTNGCQLVHLPTRKIFKPSNTLATLIQGTEFYWTVVCVVFLRDNEGKDYFAEHTYPITEPRYQYELIDFLNERHSELLNSCNQNHVINVGWLSTVRDNNVSELDISTIFEPLGGWDGLANWETDRLKLNLLSDQEPINGQTKETELQ